MTDTAIFAAGCFWGVEQSFREVNGVSDVMCGYTNGHKENPTYKEVCNGDTGHAEAVKVTFDPETVSYEDLLEHFWGTHNPTTLNKQGVDVGSQYRSGIYYNSEDQYRAALASLKAKDESGTFKNPIVTEIKEATAFWPAEEYHQRYFEKNGGGHCAVNLGTK